MNIKKTLSLLLVIIMLVSVMPVVFAAEPIALTSDNVTVWPAVEGEIYFGQTVGDALTLSGGEVKYNDTVVEGHFEFIDPAAIPPYVNSRRADIKFVPTDTALYTGFEVASCENVKFPVKKTTPVFVDENDTIPVATDVEAGAKLSTSTLSGALVKNPYYPEEPKALAGKWRWAAQSTVVTASGYFQARYVASGYEYLSVWVPVRIKGDTSPLKLPTIIEASPTIEPVTIGSKHSSLVISGGKATDIDGNELKGTFVAENPDALVLSMSASAKIVFIPEDTAYSTATVSVYLKVNATTMKFIDGNGDEIIPEIEIPYVGNSKYYNVFSTIKSKLAPYAICGESIFIADYCNDSYVTFAGYNDYLSVGTTKELEINAKSSNTNFEAAILKFKVTVVPAKATATVKYSNNSILVYTSIGSSSLNGTFEYYVNGEKIGASDKTVFDWQPKNSGVYDITVKYITGEGDRYYFEDIEYPGLEINLTWNLSVEDALIKLPNQYKESYDFAYKSEVTVIAETNRAFSHWEITDKDGNPVNIEGFDYYYTSNTFTMPDMDIIVKAIEIQPHTVTTESANISTPLGLQTTYNYYAGETVRVEFDSDSIPVDLFNGFVILDAEGNEYIPEGLTAEDLMNTAITFVMPDFDVTVVAKNAISDCKCICHHTNPITSFLWQIISFFIHLFGIDSVCACGLVH